MAACFAGALPSPCTSVSSDLLLPYEQALGDEMTDGEDINMVLDSVIVNINRIADHLRMSGENEAANHLARQMTSTFRALYEVIEPWSRDKCLMAPYPSEPKFSAASTKAGSSTAINTWAVIAATEPAANANGIIKFRPSDATKTTVTTPEPANQDTGPDAQRVVWVGEWTEDLPLTTVSKHIRDIGPIYSMAYSHEAQSVCIIFQHAHHATQFLLDCSEYVSRHGISPFGRAHAVTPGLPFATNEDLRRMEPPFNERRRLTFARSQLFSSGVTEARFRHDITRIVGEHNIELLWLFNTGNATVVFSAVPLAKLVCDTFRKFSRTKNHIYNGVQVSFSHDPCERDLHLVSQIPGHENYIGANGQGGGAEHRANRPSRSFTQSTDSSYDSRRPSTASSTEKIIRRRNTATGKIKADDDGWQTVCKRR